MKLPKPIKQENEPDNYTGRVISPAGVIYWKVNGRCHRDDGPAIEWANGSKEWYKDGKLHRVGAPARELTDYKKEWYIDGLKHREDGPAIERPNASCFKDLWYLDGAHIKTEKDYYLAQYRKYQGTPLGNKMAAKLLGASEQVTHEDE